MPPLTGARPVAALAPFWTTTDGRTARLYQGHVGTVLGALPAASVHCVVTSPPYWGLRSYDVCGCRITVQSGHTGNSVPGNSGAIAVAKTANPACAKCNGTGKLLGMEDQLGCEERPDCLGWATGAPCGACFVCHTVQWARAVRQVLRDDGTFWLNLGDTWGGRGGGPQGETGERATRTFTGTMRSLRDTNTSGLPSGTLVGIPWRCALALQADGWVLRQDLIWAKPAPMPESVRNRCTKAHEYLFLFAKGPRYYCDMEAVKERTHTVPHARRGIEKPGQTAGPMDRNGASQYDAAEQARVYGADGRSNKRSVWRLDDHRALLDWLGANAPEVLARFLGEEANPGDVWRLSSQGYKGAHFATFPPRLPELCLKMGTSERGCCGKCGAPWRRVVEEEKLTRERPNDYVKRTGAEGTGNSCANTVAGVEVRTVGWEATCGCGAGAVPCTVLDPFVGSGTTVAVAVALGRRGVGIDLSADYLRDHAVARVAAELFKRPALAGLVPRPAGLGGPCRVGRRMG